MNNWQSEILPGGPTRRIHVLVPDLQARLKSDDGRPVTAVRTQEGGPVPFSRTRLYRQVDILGPSRMIEIFDSPLPGSKGRGVLVLETNHALKVYWDRPVQTLTLVDKPALVVEPVSKPPRTVVEQPVSDALSVERAILALDERQTEDERRDGATKHLNEKGWNAADANFGTSLARWIKTSRKPAGQRLTGPQLEKARRMLRKYARQLAA